MFEHLDDPTPFQADDQLMATVVAKGRKKRFRRRFLAGTTVASATLAAVGVAGFLYADHRDQAIERVDIVNEPSQDEATNILLVGTDSALVDGEAPGGARSDTIVVVRLGEDGGLSMLSLPRDLLIPGTGNKLNSAYSREGAQGLIDTVNAMTGIPIDHYVELDFAGFVEIVDEVGGLRLGIDEPLRDVNTGLDIPASECLRLDGETALALVRARKIDGRADLGRIARQQAVMSAAVVALGEIDDPLEVDRLSRILADHARIDSSLSLEDVIHLGRRVAKAGSAGGLVAANVPLLDAPDGSSVVLAPEAPRVFAEFGAPAVPDDPAGPAPLGPTLAPPPEPVHTCP